MTLKVPLILLVFAGVAVAQSRAPVTRPSEVSEKMKQLVGRADWDLLPERLHGLDQDVVAHGLYDFPPTSVKMLTGYDNGEFLIGISTSKACTSPTTTHNTR